MRSLVVFATMTCKEGEDETFSAIMKSILDIYVVLLYKAQKKSKTGICLYPSVFP